MRVGKRRDCLRGSGTICELGKKNMDGAALKEEIGDNIWKGDRAIKFEALRHGRALFQAILVAKENNRCFMQRAENA